MAAHFTPSFREVTGDILPMTACISSFTFRGAYALDIFASKMITDITPPPAESGIILNPDRFKFINNQLNQLDLGPVQHNGKILLGPTNI